MDIAEDRAGTPSSVATRFFAPELRFILRAVSMVRDTAGLAEVGVSSGTDWNLVVRGLSRHGLVALTAHKLLAGHLIPSAAISLLRAENSAITIATLMRVNETVRIARAFDAAQIRFVVIKGVALSVQLYGSATVRGGRDIDILIDPDKAADAAAILSRLGYVPPLHAGPAPAPENPAPKETGFVHAETRILVELHDRLNDNDELLPWCFETLWAARELVEIGGERVPTMGRAHLPLYLALHGAKHGWARLMWLHDLTVLLDTPDRLERARADAAAIGLEGMMLHALWVMHHWLGKPVPPALLARAGQLRSTRLLNRLAMRFHRDPRWYEQAPRRSWRRFREGSLWSRAIGYAIKPTMRHWRRQLAMEMISPADRQLVTLPARLDWIYVLIRPVGWIIRGVRRP